MFNITKKLWENYQCKRTSNAKHVLKTTPAFILFDLLCIVSQMNVLKLFRGLNLVISMTFQNDLSQEKICHLTI